MTATAAFWTPTTGWMRRRGLKGQWTEVAYFPGVITLTGQGGGTHVLPFARIRRFRAGGFETKTAVLWSTWLWPTGGGRFELSGDRDLVRYDAFVRAAAGEMLRDHPHIQVQTGAGYFLTLYLMIAFGGMTAVVGWIAWQEWAKGAPDWFMMIIPLTLPMTLLMVFLFASHRRYLPQRAMRPADLDRGLPPGQMLKG